MKLGFLWQKTVHALKYLKCLRFRITHHALLEVTIVSLILFIALLVRLLPMRWGWHLSEFDPYYQYRLTEYMVNNGFFSWVDWHDTQRWYPYGHYVGQGSFAGLALTSAFLYKIIQPISGPYSMSLYDFCVLFPVIFGVLTCLVLYTLGKDVGGKEVGLFASLFLALNSSHIARTSLGFFDDETVGIFGILLFMLLFLRSIDKERTLNSSIKYAVLSGLSLGYVCWSWGAHLYPIAISVIFVLALVIMKRYSTRLLLSYSTTFGLALFIGTNLPKLGYRFLFSSAVLPVLGVFGILCLCETLNHIETSKWKTLTTALFFAFIGISYFALTYLGYVRPIGTKFLAVLNPFERLKVPLVQSVQEHRVTAWGSFYYDFGIGAFFLPLGLFFALRTATNRNLYLVIYGLTALYFAGSMIRLSILLAPAFAILWAIALVSILKPFIIILREKPQVTRKYRLPRVGKEFSGAIILLMILLLSFTFVLPTQLFPYPRFYRTAYSPVTIMSSSVPVKTDEPILDWYETLMWMKENLPDNAIVCSWWDYGYWITIVGNKTTLADNGTINTTQIQNIAKMFLSNETEAIQMLESYDTTHVVVFTTFTSDGRPVGYGEEGKWRWMAKIAELNETDYFKDGDWTELGKETVIYKLMTHGKETKLMGISTIHLERFEKAYFSQGKNYGGIIPLVCVYKVSY